MQRVHSQNLRGKEKRKDHFQDESRGAGSTSGRVTQRRVNSD